MPVCVACVRMCVRACEYVHARARLVFVCMYAHILALVDECIQLRGWWCVCVGGGELWSQLPLAATEAEGAAGVVVVAVGPDGTPGATLRECVGGCVGGCGRARACAHVCDYVSAMCNMCAI